MVLLSVVSSLDPSLSRLSYNKRFRFWSYAHRFVNMNRLITANPEVTKPFIDKVFAFEDLKEAYYYLESQKHVGKLVVKVAWTSVIKYFTSVTNLTITRCPTANLDPSSYCLILLIHMLYVNSMKAHVLMPFFKVVVGILTCMQFFPFVR